jgi:AcrR family transcriptional regulator
MYVQGVGATTLDDVVRASGTSKSQFYRHFPDKQALVIESPNSWPGAAQILPPDEDVATTELYGVVDAALDGLPARLAELLSLVDGEGVPSESAIRILGLDPATARRELHYARNHVRGYLDRYLTRAESS